MRSALSFAEQERRLQKRMSRLNSIVADYWGIRTPDQIAQHLSRIYGLRITTYQVWNAVQAKKSKDRKH